MTAEEYICEDCGCVPCACDELDEQEEYFSDCPLDELEAQR